MKHIDAYGGGSPCSLKYPEADPRIYLILSGQQFCILWSSDDICKCALVWRYIPHDLAHDLREKSHLQRI